DAGQHCDSGTSVPAPARAALQICRFVSSLAAHPTNWLPDHCVAHRRAISAVVGVERGSDLSPLVLVKHSRMLLAALVIDRDGLRCLRRRGMHRPRTGGQRDLFFGFAATRWTLLKSDRSRHLILTFALNHAALAQAMLLQKVLCKLLRLKPLLS